MKRVGVRQCALDFETTSLRPADGRVRLVSLCNNDVRCVVDFDQIKGGFRAVADLFADGQWIVFNAGFEKRWFLDAGCDPVIWDVENMRRATNGGGRLSLKLMVLWDLKIEMSKEQQASNWDAPELSPEQLDYAFLDADYTWRLWEKWASAADAGRTRCARLLDGLVAPVIEMEDTGMLLDTKYHQTLVDHWTGIRDDLTRRIRDLVPEDEVENINSDTQWSDYFSKHLDDDFLSAWPKTEKTGLLSMKGENLRNLAGMVPGTPLEAFFDALADYKKISKYVSSFGTTLIEAAVQHPDKRVRARFNIGAAKTLRFSSSGPNLQQVPKDKADFFGSTMSIRRSFVAGLGRKLVSFDYSGIELRVLGLVADDRQLIDDMVGGDIHSEVASFMTGRTITKASCKDNPEDAAARNKAKAVSFGIIYGSGAPGLSLTLRVSVEDAQSYIDFWRSRYPAAFQLRHDKVDESMRTKYIRMHHGGTVYFGKNGAELPKAANYPIQSAAWALMARALIRHKETLDRVRGEGRHRMTRMLSTIHDAIIDEAATKDAEEVMELMRSDMTDAFRDLFPGESTENLLEGGVGPNWAELE